MNTFKNILFDLGGVLVRLTPETCVRNFMKLGCPPSVFEGEFWLAGIFKRMDCGTATEAEFFDEIRRLGQIPHATDAEILRAWNSFLLGVEPETFEALQQLRRKYPLYILSNVNAPHWRCCRQELMWYKGENAFSWFRRTFASFEMHLEKPDHAIFRAVEREAGICPEETLFIDDREENLKGAAAVGFQTLHSVGGDWRGKLLKTL